MYERKKQLHHSRQGFTECMNILELVKAAKKRDLTDHGALLDYFESIRLLEEEDFKTAHGLNKEIRRIANEEMIRQHSTEMLEISKKSV